MAISGLTTKQMVEIPEDANQCWNWTGKISKQTGYGNKTFLGSTLLAHRWVYESLMGTIPKDKVINHKCSNRRCVNPSHLEVVTQTENCRHGAGTTLNPIQAKTIKRLKPYKVKGLQHKLAAKYNVSRQLIHDILAGRAWRNI